MDYNLQKDKIQFPKGQKQSNSRQRNKGSTNFPKN